MMRRSAILFVLLWCWSLVAGAVDGLVVLKSNYSVGETLDRAAALMEEKGITLFNRVPHSQGAAGVGIVLLPEELLLFGNPKLGSPLIQSQPTAGIDLPLKMLVWQDDAGQVWIAYNDPAWIAARHGISDQDPVLAKMAAALKGITAKAAGD